MLRKLIRVTGSTLYSSKARYASSLTRDRYPKLLRGKYATLTDADLQRNCSDKQVFERIVGDANVLRNDLDGYNTDWLDIYKGSSKCVLRPATSEECSAILKHCNQRKLAVCPQGGNTGLVGGGVPLFDEIIINMSRMNQQMQVDPLTGILTCSAGCILQQVDEYLGGHGFQMPLDLGAKGSCHIGGNVATAAGGIRLIRHGSLHAHVLGLHVVQADGTILETGSALRKDNTGLHLPHLFIGSEGVLGLITQVTMTTVPRFSAVNLTLFSLDTFENCLSLLGLCRRKLGEILCSYEFMDADHMKCVTGNLGLTNPLAHTESPFYVLVETSGSNEAHDQEKMCDLMDSAITDGVCTDGVLAQNETQRADIWKLRESGAEALRKDGYTYKQDFSLPHSMYYDLSAATKERVGDLATRVVLYGHLADGNAHLNITSPEFDQRISDKLYPWLYEYVSERHGSISAEHGLGFAKRSYAHYSNRASSLQLMRTLKQVLDPNAILNPYKVI